MLTIIYILSVFYSLYVSRTHPQKGIGGRLLAHFESELSDNSLVFVKVLKNAPWAMLLCKV